MLLTVSGYIECLHFFLYGDVLVQRLSARRKTLIRTPKPKEKARAIPVKTRTRKEKPENSGQYFSIGPDGFELDTNYTPPPLPPPGTGLSAFDLWTMLMTSLGAIAPPGVASVAAASDLTTACNAIRAVIIDYNKQIRILSHCATADQQKEIERLGKEHDKVATILATYCP